MLGPRRLATVAVIFAASMATVGCGPDEDPGYTPERREAFLAACAEGAEPAVCECTWERIVARVPPERFVALSDEIAAGGPLPADLAQIAEDCATAAVLGD